MYSTRHLYCSWEELNSQLYVSLGNYSFNSSEVIFLPLEYGFSLDSRATHSLCAFGIQTKNTDPRSDCCSPFSTKFLNLVCFVLQISIATASSNWNIIFPAPWDGQAYFGFFIPVTAAPKLFLSKKVNLLISFLRDH